MNPEDTYTVEQFIRANSNVTINYEKLSLIEKINDTQMVSYNLLNDYKKEIDSVAVTVTLSDSDYLKYALKPKLLAYDIYGSVELHFIILFLNNICNIKEFNFRKIKMLRKDDLNEILSTIYNAESATIRKNRNKLEI